MDNERDRTRARQELSSAEERLQQLKATLGEEGPPAPEATFPPESRLAAALPHLEARKLQLQATRTTSLAKEVKRLSALLKDAENSGTDWQQRWKTLEQRVEILLKELSQRDQRIAFLAEALEEAQRQNQELRPQSQDAALQEARILRNHLAQAHQAIGELTRELEDIRTKSLLETSSVRKELEALRGQLAQTSKRATEADKVPVLEEQLRQARAAEAAKIAALEYQLQQTRAAEIMRLEALQERFREEEAAEAAKRAALQGQFREQQAAAAFRIAELENTLSAERAASAAKSAGLEEQILGLKADQSSTASRIEELKRQLRIEQEDAAQKIAALENQLIIERDSAAKRVESLENQQRAEHSEGAGQLAYLEFQLRGEKQIGAGKIAGLESRLREEQAASAAKIAALENRLREEQATGAAKTIALENRLREEQATAAKKIADLNKCFEGAQKKIEELSRKAAQAAPGALSEKPAATGESKTPGACDDRGPLAAAEEAAAAGLPALPSLEPVLETAWSKVIDYMRRGLASAYAQLRKLSATPLENDQRARLRLAASSLAQGSDALTILREFLDEAGAVPSLGRIEPAISAALTVWEPALRQRGIVIARRSEGQMPQVLFHPEALHIAVYQILRNAFECMPRGGILSVRFVPDPSQDYACVILSDTGSGFSREALARLPEPFVSTKPGHLGLGLALARRILGRWGGELTAANNDKGGAAITLRFAAGQGEPPPLPAGNQTLNT